MEPLGSPFVPKLYGENSLAVNALINFVNSYLKYRIKHWHPSHMGIFIQ